MRCYACNRYYADENKACPYCGSPKNTPVNNNYCLYPGSVLADRYVIEETLGEDAAAVVYRARDSKVGTTLAIKEFFIKRLATRYNGAPDVKVSASGQEEYFYRKKRFLAEARTMVKLSYSDNMPNVFEFFEENNTAYLVMELLRGKNLGTHLSEASEPMSPDFALRVADEAGQALIELHKNGIVHCGVSPRTVFLCNDSKKSIKLLDFSAAKLSDETDYFVNIGREAGFAPIEQYESGKQIGPWSDLYSLGATLYYTLTGIIPDEAANRKKEDLVASPHTLCPKIPEELSAVIMRAMAVERHLRYRSVEEFLAALHEAAEKKPETPKKRKKILFIAIAAAIIALLTTGSTLFFLLNKTPRLKKTAITLWYCVEEGATEENAMQELLTDFNRKYPSVTVESKAIAEKEYYDTIYNAFVGNSLPTIFESTGLPNEIIKKTKALDNVLESEQFRECKFLEQYERYYKNHNQIPLGITVPVAEIITKNTQNLPLFFEKIEDLNTTAISVDPDAFDLINTIFDAKSFAGKEDFADGKSTVYLTTTQSIYDKELSEKLSDYQRSFIYLKKDAINSSFTYEWSISDGDERQIAAAEQLLTLMLSYDYQSCLMIKNANNGILPIQNESFFEKIENDDNLSPIKQIWDRLFFLNAKSEASADIAAKGICGLNGDNVKWQLDLNGELFLSGNGETAAYQDPNDLPWKEYLNQIRTIRIGEGITILGEYLFSGCKSVKSVVFPKSLRHINAFSFQYCESIETFRIPAAVTKIDSKAFDCCSALLAFTVSEKNTIYSVINGSLCSKDGKILIRVPSVFSGEYFVPESVETIRTDSFCSTNIEKVYIPSHVKSIAAFSFENCNKLKEIVVDEGNPYFSSNGNVLLSKNGTKLFLTAPSFNTTSYELPDTVQVIATAAFQYTDLSEIVFPASIKEIKADMIKKAKKDIRLVFKGDAPEMNELPVNAEHKVTIVYPEKAKGWAELMRTDTNKMITWEKK